MLEVARWRLNKTSADTQSTVRMGEFADMAGRNEEMLTCFDLPVETSGLQTIRCGAWKREVKS